MNVDVLIVGGGPAGLSAALILGRCHRSVMLCDGGRQRNLRSRAIHGLLGREGRSPSGFIEEGRHDLDRYDSVSMRGTEVSDIEPSGDAFAFICADGTRGTAAKILLATGLADDVPDLPGLDALYGISVHHCLYCDGFEYAGRPVAAYGRGDKGAELALVMKHWMADVVACSDGTDVSAHVAAKLRANDIPLRTEPVRALLGSAGKLTHICFDGGADLPRSGLFFSTGCRQSSDLSGRLGCRRDQKGGIIIDPNTEESSVPGVYVAGDASRDVLLVAVAIGEGARAAVAINKAFLRRDGLCD